MNGKQSEQNVEYDQERELLAKLEEQNRVLLSDAKAVPSLAHTRRQRGGSFSSSISNESSTDGSKAESSNGSKSSILTLPWTSVPSLPTSASLADRWAHVVKNWDQYAKKRSFVTDLIRKGIPDQFRPLVWRLYTGAYDSSVRKLYQNYLAMDSPVERAIRRDISRTYPKHEMFREQNGDGQESLFRVIKAYSVHDQEVGYCQGSGFIVGLLLMQLPEVDAFAVLVQLMSEFRLREMYKPSMVELGVCMFQLEQLLADHLPDLYTHFLTHSFAPSLYASAWFLTLFSTALSVGMATRVIDLYMVDGNYYIFRMALALLKFSSEKLLSCDMESMVVFLQREGPIQWERNAALIFQLAATFKLNTKRLKKLEKEYLQLRSQEREDQIELRRLRTENGLLLQRVARLEEECGSMADRLVQSQLVRAQESENLLSLRCQLSILRRKHDELLLPTTAEQLFEAQDPPPSTTTTEIPNGTVSVHPSHLRSAAQCVNGAKSIIDHVVQTTTELQSGVAQALASSPSSPSPLPSNCCSSSSVCNHLDSPADQLAMMTVHRLQSDLTLSRAREADLSVQLIEMKARHHELEELKSDQLTRSIEQIGILKDEIFALKSRENDATAHVEELRQRLNDIDAVWQAHLSRCSKDSKSSLLRLTSQSSSDDSAQKLTDSIAEAAFVDQKMVMKQQLNELTSQRDLAEHRADRLDQRVTELLESRASADDRERQLQLELKQAINMCAEIECKRKTDALMWRSREMELTAQLTELRQSSLHFECKYESLLASNSLQHTVSAYGDSVTSEVDSDSVVDDDRTTTSTSTATTALNEIPYPSGGLNRLTPINSSGCFDSRSSEPSLTPKSYHPVTEEDTSGVHQLWKDLPSTLMTESIGPLDELCFLPGDPLITSVYLNGKKSSSDAAHV